ncbi:AmmeMemoRadiSam system radical SAM enzyme [Selenihalanaerobacter shriftii]|uniref:Pyruvate formate lyase activating enzyme n=1 Tax=Selenihalanaerobacter shriftii TaxID=142842 RepID=A0A1T4Q5S6_9FIRM|nr:AmmeMemoRadiSam system radical SAM enzyme [Selenihalanaerobacter shriftii]SJZ99123.1 pyruvate formate lyase activating enzyme [Selenihalanaerobacter shriftii]
MKEALWYKNLEQKQVECNLCPHNCILTHMQEGTCGARVNQNSKLIAKNYGKVSATAIDPIEKKPLFHFYPGTDILSLGTVGCNLSCKFCQNHHIAHNNKAQTESLNSEEVIKLADKHNLIGVAYTYSEPIIWFEYILDTAKLVQGAGMKNVLVTNGLINPEPLKELLPYIDGFNIDLKAFTDDFYQEVCQGYIAPVKETIKLANKSSLVEVTTLLIPGLNDSEEEIKELTEWLAEIDPNIPLHFSRYFPKYKLKREPTPVETLIQAKEIAEERLNFVYLGNIQQQKYRNTYCHECNKLIVERNFQAVQLHLKNGLCPECDTEINIIT